MDHVKFVKDKNLSDMVCLTIEYFVPNVTIALTATLTIIE